MANGNLVENLPRIVIGGLGGGSGKTIVSLGLIKAFRDQGLKVKPFKKGPDYIDAAWLALAAGETSCNLDPFFLDDNTIRGLFQLKAKGYSLSIIEGNRGIFDGLDIDGSCSTVHLAKVLKAPIIVVVDCTKVTRTVAALLLGCNKLERDFEVKGVIFNRVGGERHRKILTRSVEKYTDIQVVGYLPKLKKDPIPERYMGLISHREYYPSETLEFLSKVACENLDLNKIFNMARDAEELELVPLIWPDRVVEQPVKIGIIRDSSLWFYYNENLELLERCGARIVEFSLISNFEPPEEIHGLYLGGGFPEIQAEILSKNQKMRDWVHKMAKRGMPIYAECGGFMYLCKEMEVGGRVYPMSGVFPYRIKIHKRPQGHGYTRLTVVNSNPFFKTGLEFLGHEFHYSSCEVRDEDIPFCLELKKGVGILSGMDGLNFMNTFASYNHIHGLHIPTWGKNFVKACDIFRSYKKINSNICPKITARY